MIVRLFFSDGTQSTPSATLSSGFPIVPSRGDTIMLRGVPHVVTHVQWDYDAREIGVMCTRPNESPQEKLYYDDKTLDIVYDALMGTCGLSQNSSFAAVNEMINNGILFRERAKD